MKHLELHILQSFPVACLNRDDLNSPKTAIFGGVQRARVSSQSWKRAIRDYWKADDKLSPRFSGIRTRYIIEPLTDIFKALGNTEENSSKAAYELAIALATKDTETRTKTLFYATPGELSEFATIYSASTTKAAQKKAIEALIKKAPTDAADIALFGRMVASDYTAKLEGAAMFSHALSTHKVDNEIDFFAAVDDSQPEDQLGAGMTSTLEFNSATYYRFAALNLDMLADKPHLQVLTTDERREVVRAFIEATLQAVPGARKNSMNAATLPGYVLGVVRGSGHPVQLINAFEAPIRASGGKGIFKSSLDALEAERKKLNETWGLNKKELFSGAIPDLNLADFIAKVLAHVA